MQALAFTEIQKSEERIFEMTVADAHTGRVLSSGERVLAGQAALNAIAPGVSLDLDGIIGVSKVKYYEDLGTFKVNTDPNDPTALFTGLNIERYVHVADNALVLQIGANEKEDTVLVLGDMTAKALRILNLEVRSREEAARSLTRLDSAIKRVSTQRAIIGAQINRLEHTMSNLTTASLNLTEAKSRITDADFAKEMMEFTRLNIITQAGHSMMAQANQLSNNILTLMP
jgi:flagellin